MALRSRVGKKQRSNIHCATPKKRSLNPHPWEYIFPNLKHRRQL
ncbi:MAG: hypothetical protein ACRC2R_03830 [Xenococcaceae cyanobacterium]